MKKLFLLTLLALFLYSISCGVKGPPLPPETTPEVTETQNDASPSPSPSPSAKNPSR